MCWAGMKSRQAKPQRIYKLLHHWEADMGQALMVGDYLYDFAMHGQAGVCSGTWTRLERFPWPEYTDLGGAGFI